MPSIADRVAERLEQFSTRVIKFVRTLPRHEVGKAIADQLARCGPGIASNHRSARRARSRGEFISRLAVALDEADESEYWLSETQAGGVASGSELEWLLQILNDVRVGSWIILGSPEQAMEFKLLNEKTAADFWAMEMSGQFQMNFLAALEKREV